MPGTSRPPPEASAAVSDQGDASKPQSPPSARPPPAHAPVRFSLSTGIQKRAAPSRSRGDSPPEKRPRPSSPARSRRGSAASLPSSHHARAPGDQNVARRSSTTHSSLHGQSPGNRSGASTPVQPAPMAPSMVPKTSSLPGSTKQQASLSLAALQGLKARKQAIYLAMKPQSEETATSSLLLKRLKDKEAENLELQEKLKALQDLPRQMTELQTRLNKLPDYSDAVKEALKRLGELEKKTSDQVDATSLEGIRQDIKALQTSQSAPSIYEVIKSYIEPNFNESKTLFLKEISAAEARSNKANKERDINVQNLTKKFNTLDATMKNVQADVRRVETNEQAAYHKLDRYRDDLDDIERYIGTKDSNSGHKSLHNRVKELCVNIGQVRSFQSELSKLGNQLTKLTEGQVTMEAQKTKLEMRLTHLEKKADANNTSATQVTSTLGQSSQQRDDLQAVKSPLANMKNQLPPSDNVNAQVTALRTALDADIDRLYSGLGNVEKAVQDQSTTIEALQDNIESIFRAKFDPLKQDMDARMSSIQQKAQALNDVVSNLQQQSHAMQATSTTSTEGYPALKKQIEELQASMTNEISLRVAEIDDVKKMTDDAIESLKFAFRSHQDQYNNISTEEIYTKMVDWFLQAYPANATNMVQQFGSLQTEVQNLHQAMQTLDSSSWVQSATFGTLEMQVNELKDQVSSLDVSGRAEHVGYMEELGVSVRELRENINRMQAEFIEPNREALGSFSALVKQFHSIQTAFQLVCDKMVTKDGRAVRISWGPAADSVDGTNGT
ncbi:hypothetical protein ACEQ8H_006297 [Pleosporales sp. CAS-2024a]